MLLSMPSLREFRDLLLVLVFAAAATVSGAVAAELALPTFDTPPMRMPPVLMLHATRSGLEQSPCDCAAMEPAPRPLPRTSGRLVSPQSAALSAQAQGRGRAPEAGSFGGWTRAETDPRTILARLAVLSRNAPRSYADDPGPRFASPNPK